MAIPSHDSPPVELAAWRMALEGVAPPVRLGVEEGETFLEIEYLRARGQVSFEGPVVEAILFEIEGEEAGRAVEALERAARVVGYELHDPTDEDDEDDDE